MARSSLLAAWGRLAHSRCATQRAERQRQRPDAEIVFGGEISCHPPMRVARGVPALDDFTNEAYSALMLAALMTFPHVSVSPLMRAVNSSGVLPTGSKPSAAKRSFISGDAMLLTISRYKPGAILRARSQAVRTTRCVTAPARDLTIKAE